MYIKLQIFIGVRALKILEQKDTPPREILCDIGGIRIKSMHGPDICYFNSNNITFYIRGDDHSRDLTVLDYFNEPTLHKILTALATVASVDIIWS